MRVLVTGGTGYLGQHVLSQLRIAGIDAIVMGRNKSSNSFGFPFVEADLLLGDDLRPLIDQVRPSHLLHLAWYAEHGKYWSSPLNFDWVIATLRLSKAFVESGGTRMVVAGSCAEYAWHDGFLDEIQSPRKPSTIYGVAKDATRRLLEAKFKELGLGFAWGHIFFPFGPGEASARMIPSLIEVFRGRKEPFGINLTASRGMLYVPDAARAFVTLLQSSENGAFNICSGSPFNLSEVVKILAEACKSDASSILNLETSRPGEPKILVGDSTRLQAIGWKPQWSVREGLIDMVRQIP